MSSFPAEACGRRGADNDNYFYWQRHLIFILGTF
jgi:hypothetical protein